MTRTDQAIAAIRASAQGPEIGAFFDFDGTLIDGFSATSYFTDRVRKGQVSLSEVSELTKLALAGEPDESGFAEIIGRGITDWAGMSEEEISELWTRLFRSKIAANMFPEAWALVKAHQKMGHTVVIASSATRYQIAPAAAEFEIDQILSTPVKVRRGRLTGGLDGQPLWGSGKAEAVKKFAKANGVKLASSFGYANGNEDIAFLETVGHPVAVNPKPVLARTADERSWPTLQFAPRKKTDLASAVRSLSAYTAMSYSFLAGLTYSQLTGQRRQSAELTGAISSDLVLALAGINLDVQGEQHLWSHRPAVFIINHQSKLDAQIVLSLLRRDVVGVAKKEAADLPGVGTILNWMDTALIDRKNTANAIEALQPALERLRSGISVALAPEGTRSYSPRLSPFKKGAFHLAMQAGVPIVPIVIRNAGELASRNAVVMRPGTVQVSILPPIDVSSWSRENLDAHVEDVQALYRSTLEDWPVNVRQVKT